MLYQNIPLILMNRHPETADSESFYFQSNPVQAFSFKPGQFALLAVNINGTQQVRAYSISSQPNCDTLKLTIKRVTAGLVSNWLIDNLHPNDQIELQGITGEFNIIDRPYQTNILFISAGCGITPVMSMAQYLLSHSIPTNIHFLHCAKDALNIIYQHELQDIASKNSQFNYHLCLKNKITDKPLPNSSIGRVTAGRLNQLYPDIQQYTVFLCGSHHFTTEIADLLQSLHFNMEQFFHENFTIDQSCSTANNNQTLRVTVPSFAFEKTASLDDNLLTILESGQLPIISACRAGVCGSCKCKVESGVVESSSTATLTQAEIEQGYHLACSTKIKSDVQISLN